MKNRLLIFIIIIIGSDLRGQMAKTTFGLQYKPIIPIEYFNPSSIKKNEGDLCTPVGKFVFETLLYRKDRIKNLNTYISKNI